MIWIILGAALIIALCGVLMIVLFFSRSGDERTNRRGEREKVTGKYDRGTSSGLDRAVTDRPARRPAETTTTKTANVGVGNEDVGVSVRVSGAGDNLSDLDFRVTGIIRYKSDRENWTEYYGSYRGRQVAVETFDDDAHQVGVIASEAAITLAQLGLTEDDLIRWDEGDGPGRPFEFDGATWEFVWSGEVACSEENSSHCEGYYGWDFAEQGGQRILCVEKREGEAFEVILMQLVDANRFRISGN